MIMRWSRLYPLVLILLCGSSTAQDIWRKEGDELAVLLHWRTGDTIAEIGAGKGKMTSIAAERVGVSGRVHSADCVIGRRSSGSHPAQQTPNCAETRSTIFARRR